MLSTKSASSKQSSLTGTTEISERVYLTIADAPVNEDCFDDADFVDSMNSDCSGWHGYDCTWDEDTHTGWGYSEQDLLDIQEACPMTCGSCGGTEGGASSVEGQGDESRGGGG